MRSNSTLAWGIAVLVLFSHWRDAAALETTNTETVSPSGWSADVIVGGVNDRFSSTRDLQRTITSFAAGVGVQYTWLDKPAGSRTGWINHGDLSGTLFSNEKLFVPDTTSGAIEKAAVAEVSGAVRVGRLLASKNFAYLCLGTSSIAGIRSNGHWPNQKFFGVGVENQHPGLLCGSNIEFGIGDSELFEGDQSHNRTKLNIQLVQALHGDSSSTLSARPSVYARFEFDTHRRGRQAGVDNLRIFFGARQGIGALFSAVSAATGESK